MEEISGVNKFVKGFWGEKTKMPVPDLEVRGVSFILLAERFEGKHGGRIISYKSVWFLLMGLPFKNPYVKG